MKKSLLLIGSSLVLSFLIIWIFDQTVFLAPILLTGTLFMGLKGVISLSKESPRFKSWLTSFLETFF